MKFAKPGKVAPPKKKIGVKPVKNTNRQKIAAIRAGYQNG